MSAYSGGGAPTEAPANQGLSSADIAAMQNAGVSYEAPAAGTKVGDVGASAPQIWSPDKMAAGTPSGGGTLTPSGSSTKAPTQATPHESYSHPAPTEPVPNIDSLTSIIAAMGGTPTTLPMMADGGTIAPGGDAAITGEAGPEVVQTQPNGGATVTPMAPQGAPVPAQTPLTPGRATPPDASSPFTAAQPEEKSLGARFLSTLGNMALGAGLGQRGAEQVFAFKMAQNRQLVDMAMKNPMLLHSDPSLVQRVDSMLGKGASQAILNAMNPEAHNAILARTMGLSVPFTPGGGVKTEDIVKAVQGRFGVQIGPTGAIAAIKSQAPTAADLGNTESTKMLYDYADKFQQNGLDQNTAMKQAAVAVMKDASARGLVVPPDIRRLATADTDISIEADKAGAQENARQQSMFGWAGLVSQARHAGMKRGEFQAEAEQAGAGNVFLGPKPSDKQVQSLAMRGYGITTDQSGNVIAVSPGGTAPAGTTGTTPAAQLLVKPQQIQVANFMTRVLNSSDPAFMKSFPSEAEYTRLGARGMSALQALKIPGTDRSYRDFFDDPANEAKRKQFQQFAVDLDRMATNGVPRAAAILEGFKALPDRIASGNASREEVSSFKKALRDLVNDLGPQKTALALRDDIEPGSFPQAADVLDGKVQAQPAAPKEAPEPAAPAAPAATSGPVKGAKGAERVLGKAPVEQAADANAAGEFLGTPEQWQGMIDTVQRMVKDGILSESQATAWLNSKADSLKAKGKK